MQQFHITDYWKLSKEKNNCIFDASCRVLMVYETEKRARIRRDVLGAVISYRAVVL